VKNIGSVEGTGLGGMRPSRKVAPEKNEIMSFGAFGRLKIGKI